MQAAPVDEVGARRLQLRHDGRIVLLAGVHALVEHRLHAVLGERIHGGVGETLPVGGLVMKDGDLLALHVVGDVLGRNGALLVVAAAGAEHVPLASFGQLRIGGRRGDHQHVVVEVDVRGRDRHARVEVADHPLDAVADELVGDRHALLGIGNVVADLEGDLLAQNAALGVDVFHRLLGALLQLRPEGRVGAGDGTGDAELDVGMSRAREGQTSRKHEARSTLDVSSSIPFENDELAGHSTGPVAAVEGPQPALRAAGMCCLAPE